MDKTQRYDNKKALWVLPKTYERLQEYKHHKMCKNSDIAINILLDSLKVKNVTKSKIRPKEINGL